MTRCLLPLGLLFLIAVASSSRDADAGEGPPRRAAIDPSQTISETTFVVTAGPVIDVATTEGGSNLGGGARVDATYVIGVGVGVRAGYAFAVHGTDCPQDASCWTRLAEQQHVFTVGPAFYFAHFGYTQLDLGVGYADYESGGSRKGAAGPVVGSALGLRVPVADNVDARVEVRGHLWAGEDAVVLMTGAGFAVGTYW